MLNACPWGPRRHAWIINLEQYMHEFALGIVGIAAVLGALWVLTWIVEGLRGYFKEK